MMSDARKPESSWADEYVALPNLDVKLARNISESRADCIAHGKIPTAVKMSLADVKLLYSELSLAAIIAWFTSDGKLLFDSDMSIVLTDESNELPTGKFEFVFSDERWIAE